MPFTDVSPPETNTTKTGITFSLSEGKRSRTARLTFTEAAQNDIFAGPICGKKFFAKVGRGQDEGRLLLVQQDDGDLVASKSMRGSSSIKMKAWDLLPHGKMPAQTIELIGAEMGGLIFQLPPWARPSGAKGRLEQEHALKRPERAKP